MVTKDSLFLGLVHWEKVGEGRHGRNAAQITLRILLVLWIELLLRGSFSLPQRLARSGLRLVCTKIFMAKLCIKWGATGEVSSQQKITLSTWTNAVFHFFLCHVAYLDQIFYSIGLLVPYISQIMSDPSEPKEPTVLEQNLYILLFKIRVRLVVLKFQTPRETIGKQKL